MTHPASFLAVWPRNDNPSAACAIDRNHIDPAALDDDECEFLFADLEHHLGEFVDPAAQEVVALFAACNGVDPAAATAAEVRCWLLDGAQHNERFVALLALLALRRGAISAEHVKALLA